MWKFLQGLKVQFKFHLQVQCCSLGKFVVLNKLVIHWSLTRVPSILNFQRRNIAGISHHPQEKLDFQSKSLKPRRGYKWMLVVDKCRGKVGSAALAVNCLCNFWLVMWYIHDFILHRISRVQSPDAQNGIDREMHRQQLLRGDVSKKIFSPSLKATISHWKYSFMDI